MEVLDKGDRSEMGKGWRGEKLVLGHAALVILWNHLDEEHI